MRLEAYSLERIKRRASGLERIQAHWRCVVVMIAWRNCVWIWGIPAFCSTPLPECWQPGAVFLMGDRKNLLWGIWPAMKINPEMLSSGEPQWNRPARSLCSEDKVVKPHLCTHSSPSAFSVLLLNTSRQWRVTIHLRKRAHVKDKWE